MRIFCMCYFRWTVQEFEQVWNPSNCEIWVMEKDDKTGRYRFSGRLKNDGDIHPVRFGEQQREQILEHMKTISPSRKIKVRSIENIKSNNQLIHFHECFE
eukprot:TRINITY_DN18049_c0_g1_i2.p1 TRINITY_DN18049_c0_g1~~TRINITY_DN18049_c0_g1_i2.p1  ORF type:complete len:100 (+),score=17.92 TRINITY_DN18049_c0_g1_i2:169-468(+)